MIQVILNHLALIGYYITVKVSTKFISVILNLLLITDIFPNFLISYFLIFVFININFLTFIGFIIFPLIFSYL